MSIPPQGPRRPWWQQPVPPVDPVTRRLPRARPAEPPTDRFRPPEPPTDRLRPPYQPPEPPTAKIPRPSSPADARPTDKIECPGPAASPAGQAVNRQSIILIAIIVVAVLVGGLAGAELYARHRAGTVLAGITDCLVQDKAAVSYAVTPPFLWQYLTDRYTDISVITAGRRVQEAQGMTADVTLSDIQLQDGADSKGTIGEVDATLSWTADGIKATVAENLPVVGDLVTDVRADASAGTLIMEATGGTSITARPEVNRGNLDLTVLDVTGPFGKDAVQTAFNELTTTLNDNYPLGIKADSIRVTDTGIVGTFSSRDASIPTGESDSCFADL